MSIIIRLQNLPLSANSLDIRKYFSGLSIPDGGVHIVGGEKGDAFIAFSSDDDARQAMARDGGKIKESSIKLFLSSRSEMQQVITQARSVIAATLPSPPSLPSTIPSTIPPSLPPTLPPASVSVLSNYKPNVLLPASHQHPPPASNSFVPQTPYVSGNVPRSGMDGRGQRDRSRSPLRVGPSNGQMSSNQGLGVIRPVATPMGGLAPVIPSDSMDVRGRLGYLDDTSKRLGYLDDTSKRLGYLDDTSNGARVQSGLQLDEGPRGQWSRRPDLNPSSGFDDRINSQPPSGSMFDQRTLVAKENLDDSVVAASSRGGQKGFSGRVEMRNLPFSVTIRDIQDFFRLGSGLLIPEDSVRILVDERGFTTGGATVRMGSEQDLIAAVGLSGRLIANNPINITPMPVDLNPDLGRLNDLNPDLGRLNDQIVQSNNFVPSNTFIPNNNFVPNVLGNNLSVVQNLSQNTSQNTSASQQHPQRDLVIYMKGIPFNACTEKDVANFFIGLQIHEVVFEMDRRTGKPAGNAYVQFKGKDDYERALEMNLKHMGRRYIEVFPTTREDMEEARSVGSGVGRNKETYCVNISGLPPSVTNSDLTSYFKESGAIPFAIHIMLKANGTNAGEAFIEFADRETQTRALSRHGDVINGYRITIKETPFVYMQRIVGRPSNPPGPVFVDHRTRPSGNGRPGFRGNRGSFPRGGRGGNRFSEREGSQDRSSPGTRKDSFSDDSRSNVHGSNVHGSNVHGSNVHGSNVHGSNVPFKDSRSIVHASNVPYKATNDDLAAFFADFALIPGSIERKLNERGMATPEARIAFKTPFEAERAAKAMHKKHLLGRPVFLRIA